VIRALRVHGSPGALAGIILLALATVILVSCGDDDGTATPSSSVAGITATPAQTATQVESTVPPERLVVTYFYYWYDIPDGPHSEPLTDHPAEPDASYLDVDWFKKQFRDMNEAGIDVALASYWGKFEPSSNVGLDAMVLAYDEMVDEGESPPKIGMFLDTGAIARLEPQYRDLTQPQNQEIFYSLIRGYYNDMPERVWARIDGRPVIWLWAAYFGIQFDSSLFEYVTSQFEADYGVRPYIVGEDIWRYAHPSGGGVDYDAGVMPLDDFYIWGAASNGFQEPTGGVAEVGPGYDERTLPGPDRIGRYQDREGGDFYAENFQLAIDSGSPIIAIETWNEFHEASDIADSVEYGRQYIEMTREFVDQFKGLTPTPTPPSSVPTTSSTPQPSIPASPPAAPTSTPPGASPPTPTGSFEPTATPEPNGALRGDQDCDQDVDTGDAIVLLRVLAGHPLAASLSCATDVDCDGVMTAADALGILVIVIEARRADEPGCAS